MDDQEPKHDLSPRLIAPLRYDKIVVPADEVIDFRDFIREELERMLKEESMLEIERGPRARTDAPPGEGGGET